ncbi:hypothetical protein QBC38DRAFT_519322 [Podospora fimiseda]|uniref:Uncharacterized protein n=1 Tax=Podospora fimiseda TaxID=252190 RepID=A0AAN6YSV3_9PEZI|nr:hypothetical protein QBC38DRAFT_519322 [Podospora fimiseda]
MATQPIKSILDPANAMDIEDFEAKYDNSMDYGIGPVSLVAGNFESLDIDTLAQQALANLTLGQPQEEAIMIRDKMMSSVNNAEAVLASNPQTATVHFMIQVCALEAKVDAIEREQEKLVKEACHDLIKQTIAEMMEDPTNKKIKSINGRINNLEVTKKETNERLVDMRTIQYQQSRLIEHLYASNGKNMEVVLGTGGNPQSMAAYEESLRTKKRKTGESESIIPQTAASFRALRTSTKQLTRALKHMSISEAGGSSNVSAANGNAASIFASANDSPAATNGFPVPVNGTVASANPTTANPFAAANVSPANGNAATLFASANGSPAANNGSPARTNATLAPVHPQMAHDKPAAANPFATGNVSAAAAANNGSTARASRFATTANRLAAANRNAANVSPPVRVAATPAPAEQQALQNITNFPRQHNNNNAANMDQGQD